MDLASIVGGLYGNTKSFAFAATSSPGTSTRESPKTVTAYSAIAAGATRPVSRALSPENPIAATVNEMAAEVRQ